ncbi:MAG: hypothetical protein ACRCWG_06560 [Sarcina sp.]
MKKKRYLIERKRLRRFIKVKIKGEGNTWFKEFIEQEMKILELKNSKQ